MGNGSNPPIADLPALVAHRNLHNFADGSEGPPQPQRAPRHNERAGCANTSSDIHRIVQRFVDANKERLHRPLDIAKQSPSDGTALRSKSLGSIHSGKTNFDPFMLIKLILI